MTKNTKLMLATAAMGGLLAGATSRLSAATTPAPAGAPIAVAHSATPVAQSSNATPAGTKLANSADADKHDCKGQNSCKGKGGCKTSDNGCKGKNSCKGKGGCSSIA